MHLRRTIVGKTLFFQWHLSYDRPVLHNNQVYGLQGEPELMHSPRAAGPEGTMDMLHVHARSQVQARVCS